MKRKMGVSVALLLALAALTVMTGCRWVKFPTFTETTSIPLRGATTVTAQIQQSVGELTLRASAVPTDGVQADFTYAPEDWKPDVVTSSEASSASFRISSPASDGRSWFGYMRNTWVITMPTGVKTDLGLDLGVGTSTVDLRGIDVASLSVRTGVGETSIDLSGTRTHNVTVRVQAGVGNLTLRLPRTISVKVTTPEKGVGNLSAPGFIQNGDLLINGEFLVAGPTIDIELVRGVGNVTLELTD